MTVNVTILFSVFLGAAIYGNPPFSIVQLLWFNLIMDVLAAVAISADKPEKNILAKYRPVKSSDSIITNVMMRQVLGVALY